MTARAVEKKSIWEISDYNHPVDVRIQFGYDVSDAMITEFEYYWLVTWFVLVLVGARRVWQHRQTCLTNRTLCLKV